MSIAPSANADWGPFVNNCFCSVSATLNISVTKWRNETKHGYIFAEVAYGLIAIGAALEALIRLVCSFVLFKCVFSLLIAAPVALSYFSRGILELAWGSLGDWKPIVNLVYGIACAKGIIVVGGIMAGAGLVVLETAGITAGTAVDAACSLVNNFRKGKITLDATKAADIFEFFKGTLL